jgi:hypothetical protein
VRLLLPLDSKRDARSAQYREIDTDVLLWNRSHARRTFQLVTDRRSVPRFVFQQDRIAHVCRAGSVLRVYRVDGRSDDYDLAPTGSH